MQRVFVSVIILLICGVAAFGQGADLPPGYVAQDGDILLTVSTTLLAEQFDYWRYTFRDPASPFAVRFAIDVYAFHPAGQRAKVDTLEIDFGVQRADGGFALYTLRRDGVPRTGNQYYLPPSTPAEALALFNVADADSVVKLVRAMLADGKQEPSELEDVSVFLQAHLIPAAPTPRE